jgi:predicted RNase H-like HicB family nuclease
MKNRAIELIIERDLGGYYGFCPQFRGSYTVGRTYDETLNRLKDNIQLCLSSGRGRHHPKAPTPEFVGMTWEQLIRSAESHG